MWDFRRKRGVLYREVVLPPDAPAWAGFRARLWNAAEAAEKRKNATVGREFEIALPAELAPRERQALAVGFARELVARHGFAADVVLHAPHRMGNGLNYHAHILCSTRRLKAEGFGEKTRELDDLKKGPVEVERWRTRWAEVQNQALAERGYAARVDHRSLQAQGVEREPTRHMGPAITAMERRGIQTEVGERLREEQQREIPTGLEQVAQVGPIERETQEVGKSILNVSSPVAAAVHAWDELMQEEAERVRAAAVKAWESRRSAREKEAERARAAAVKAWELRRSAWEKEVERIRTVARETWELRRSAREKPHKRGRDHDDGLDLEGGLKTKRMRSRDGPEFG
jgi:ATP-dependent exoDNAse (exonuclease V) alpha subunit